MNARLLLERPGAALAKAARDASDALAARPETIKLWDLAAGRPSEGRDPRWGGLRLLWLRLHPACAVCGYGKGLNVHHIRPFHLFPDLELAPSNLITLGERCPTGNHHLLLGHFGNWSKWDPDVEEVAAFLLANFARKQAGFEPAPPGWRAA